eukprot:14343860-Alexandrium_andersonii.AAC.1
MQHQAVVCRGTQHYALVCMIRPDDAAMCSIAWQRACSMRAACAQHACSTAQHHASSCCVA